jgi:hypothetical protein
MKIPPDPYETMSTSLRNSLLDIGDVSLDYGNDAPEKGNEPA